jgi:tetratricopeptide (TPR) repeat protein
VGGRADAAEYKQELLGRLGLRADASDQDVESAHNGLVEFLELAPHEVKTWAQAQTADVDEAFAILSGPETDMVPPTGLVALAQDAPVEAPAVEAPATAAQLPAPATAPPAPATSTAGASSWMPTALAGNKPLQKKISVAAAIVLIAGIGVGVYFNKGSDVPGINGTPTGQSQASATPSVAPVDQAKVSALMKKISANPKDTVSLLGLGDLYFAANDYKNASLWEQKVLAIEPKNQAALLSLGAAFYNQGNMVEAKKPWLTAATLYPKLATVHNNLGFLYMSQEPADNAAAIVEFNKVIAIDPKSEAAKTVLTHLKGLQSAAPTATPSAK